MAILVAADLVSGVGLLQLPIPSSAADLRAYQAQVEQAWDGGGGQTLFADDFGARTAEWIGRTGVGIDGYRGGALPEAGDSPAKWAQDLYRWGHAATRQGAADGWDTSHDGFVQFGDPATGYPLNAYSELVSPVIDLRGLPTLTQQARVRASGNPDPLGRHQMQCPPNNDPAGINGQVNCPVAAAVGDQAEQFFGPDGRRVVSSPVQDASAALFVRHAYDFHVGTGGRLEDGGRVVLSTFDPTSRAWTPWEGIVPTDQALQIGSQQFQARRTIAPGGAAGSHTVEADVHQNATSPGAASGSPDAQVTVVNDGGSVTVDPTNQTVSSGTVGTPQLYQGPIVTSSDSGTPWTGFGGASRGLVDSLFDLSAYAGRLVRIGFQAASGEGDQAFAAEAGWRLDNVEVHASGQPAIQVVGLAQPGDGAAVPPGSDVKPTLVLRNTGSSPADVLLTTTAGGQRKDVRVRLSVGPLATLQVATGLAFDGIGTGLVPVDVVAATAGSLGGPAQGQYVEPVSTTAHFHFLAAAATGWSAARPTFAPDHVEAGKATKLVARNQGANITVLLENTGTAQTDVHLGRSAQDPGDLRPVLVDESGAEYGTMVPLAGTVRLPVARAIAGTLGTPIAARVATWHWSGSDVARALRLRLLDGTGRVLQQGGDVMVQTVAPNPLDVDFRNLWDYAAGNPACDRRAEWEGQTGVVRCPAAVGGQPRVVSPVRRLFEIDLFRGNQTSYLLSYQGGAVRARVEAVASATGSPDLLPPAGAAWQTIDEHVFPATGPTPSWTTRTAPGPQLPPGFVGHVRLVLESADGSGFDVDEAGLYLTLRNTHGGEVSVPVVADRFDTTLVPSKEAVFPSTSTGLAILDGVDRATKPVADNTTGVFDGSTVKSLSGASTPPIHDTSLQTRFLEDSYLNLTQPIDLTRFGRPVLSFRQWLDTGFYGTAFVEVAPASLVHDVAPAAADAGPGTVGGWKVVAQFSGTDLGRNTLPVEVPLWDYAGQKILLRFRFHIDPEILMASADGAGFVLATSNPTGVSITNGNGIYPQRTNDARPTGWILEGIKVSGWDGEGPAVVHEAGNGFPGYGLVGGSRANATIGYAVSDAANCWSPPATFDSACTTPHGVSTLVTEPMAFDAMDRPFLTLTHSGNLNGGKNIPSCSFPALDLEYQKMAGGLPAGPWAAGTPTEGFTFPSSGNNWLGWRRIPPEANPDPPGFPTAELGAHGPPFAGIHPLRDAAGKLAQNGCVYTTSQAPAYPDGYQFDQRDDLFDLSTLTHAADGARVRLDVWSERAAAPGFERITAGTPIGQYNLTAVRIAESRQFIDAKVDSITTTLDDRERLLRYDPGAARRYGITDQVVLSQDVATFVVNVTNVGQADLEADVSLRAAPLVGTTPIDVTWMEDLGTSLRASGSPTGHVKVESGKTAQVIFQANFLEAPPGAYRLAARVDATTGVDTAPLNDLKEQDVLLLPFRRLELEPDGAAVAPFAAEATAPRTIHATVANQGNVDEGSVVLRADIVRMTGLTSFAPLDPPVEPTPLGATTLGLDRRGDGRLTAAWTLGPLGPDAARLFPSGQKYAVRVRADPGHDSVKAWWASAAGLPLAEGDDGSHLLNLTQMPDTACNCILIPFLVERLLYGTDFSPANSTSVLPQVLPVDSLDSLLKGWRATTVVDGAPLAPGERPDIPRWQLVPATNATLAQTFPGTPTGNVWMLPAYAGVERIEQRLESPALPAHVVRGTSRSILSMTYASGVPQGQAVLETRSLVAGQWTPWRPIDTARSQRIAIVLSYDFPRVLPTGLGSLAALADDVVLSGTAGGHPGGDLLGKPLRDGGVARFCYLDADGSLSYSAGDPVYLASDCIRLAPGALRLANPPAGGVGSTVADGDPDAGHALGDLGHAIGTASGRWLADLDGDGRRSAGDVVLLGDATEPRGTVLHSSGTASPNLGDPLTPGLLRRMFTDADGDGTLDAADTVVLHTPSLTADKQYDAPQSPHGTDGTLRASNHPGPSWYGNPLNIQTISANGGPGSTDQAPQCNVNSTVALPLCNWSPGLRFEMAGNEQWVDALDEALLQFSRTLGADNVGLFSTVVPGGMLGIGHADGGAVVHEVRDGLQTLRFPIRDLDALGIDLDHYGAILLMGDGATKAFAAESQALQNLHHGPGDTADPTWLSPAEQALAKLHNDRLKAILTAAAPAGIRVLGALGPAGAALAHTDVVPGATLSVWQTTMAMPHDELHMRAVGSFTQDVYCSGAKRGLTGDTYPAPTTEAQPIAACQKSDQGSAVVDSDDHHNYFLISPYDQDSLFLREMVEQHAKFPLLRYGSINQLSDTCSPDHPLVARAMATSAVCDVIAHASEDQAGPFAVFSEANANPADVDHWSHRILDTLAGEATGALPEGGWQPLPSDLAFPFGGSFVRRADGSDAFDGAPTQVRVVVRGDEATHGHGAFAVDRVALLGTNRGVDLGVAFSSPRDGLHYAPGGIFPVRVAVTNRGTSPTPATQATVTMERLDLDGCAVAPWEPVTLAVPRLDAGANVTLAVKLNGGFLPSSPGCPISPADQQSRYTLTAALDPAWSDDDARDDLQRVQVVGQQTVVLDAASVGGVTVTPERATYAPDTPIAVAVDVHNRGTNGQTFRMQVTLADARPLVCMRRDNPAQPKDDNLYGCTARDAKSTPVPLPGGGLVALDVLPDATGTLRLDTTVGDLGLPAGVYRVGIRLLVSDTAGRTLAYPPADQLPLQRLIRLVPADDPAAARRALPPDGAYGFLSDGFDGLYQNGTLGPFLPSYEGQWPGSTIAPRATGLYGPDASTTDRSQAVPVNLRHGWLVGGCDPATPKCSNDSTRSYIEWTRDGAPSYRVGVDPPAWQTAPTGNNNPQDPDSLGYGDFGPDTLTWSPLDVSDHQTDPASRVPYLSLASYQSPTLSFLTNFQATPNTAFVVEMQVPQRVTCASRAPSAPGYDCSRAGWNWDTGVPPLVLTPSEVGGVPLPANNGNFDTQHCSPPSGNPESFSEVHGHSVQGGAAGQTTYTCYYDRNIPSNPLATEGGFWGQHSTANAEDGGWVRVHIPLTVAAQGARLRDYCATIAGLGGFTTGEMFRPSEFDPCAYAHATDGDYGPADNGPETYVARPVRFRFRAASFGGDAGVSDWKVADLQVTDHRLAFLGPSQVAVRMNDDDTRLVPVRVANNGEVPDRVDVAWLPPRGKDVVLGRGGAIAIGTTPDLHDAADHLVLDLAPHASRVVWVRIHTGILARATPGATPHIPFLLHATSLLDPTLVEEMLVDASFTTHAWPDLVATKLVIGDNDGTGGVFAGSLGSPLKATLSFRNLGELPIGSAEQPIHVSLVAEQIGDDGTPVPGTRQVVDQQLVDATVLPYGQDRKDHFVSFGEWLPPALGLYQLSAELNYPGPVLPESSTANNVAARIVAVGPVRFADLQVTDLWAVEFHTKCGDAPVDRLVAGHAYCLAARVKNVGMRSALEPRIDFGVGASAPFSSGAPTLAAQLPDGIFPAADQQGTLPERVVVSSPRAIVAPPAGSPGITFYAEVSSRSIMPNFEGKSLKVTLPVDVYQLAVGTDATRVDLAPGREVRVPLQVGNRGNSPATPGVTLAGITDRVDLALRLDGARTLLAGENATMTLVLDAGRQLDAQAQLGDLTMTVAEDPHAAIPLGITVHVADGGLPAAQALLLRSAPGPANATVVLDASSSPVGYTWRAEAVKGAKGPVQVAGAWGADTQPFGVEVATVPLAVASTAPPGATVAPLRLIAAHEGVEVVVPVNVTLDVASRPALAAHLEPDHHTAAPGALAGFTLVLNNTGNVPLSPHVANSVDLGQVDPAAQDAALLPGQSLSLPFTALAGPFPRALGQTQVAWSTPGGRTGNLTLPWRLDVSDARFTIAGALPALHPTAGKSSQVQVPVRNNGTAPAEAEVLLAVDGVLQSRRTVTLDPGEVRQVAIPFKAGAAGAHQDLEVLVRPAGSDAWLGDAALYDAGDVGHAALDPVAGHVLPIPGAELVAAVLAVAGAALAARRRRA